MLIDNQESDKFVAASDFGIEKKPREISMEELRGGEMSAARHPYTRGLLACRPSLDHPGQDLPVLQREASWLQ